MRHGFTLVELACTLVIMAIIMAMGVPWLRGTLDRLAVDRAVFELATFYHSARYAAITRGRSVTISLDRDSLSATLIGVEPERIATHSGPSRYRVQSKGLPRHVRILPNGLGYAAGNFKIVLRRGAAAESLTTSRLGRLKVWR